MFSRNETSVVLCMPHNARSKVAKWVHRWQTLRHTLVMDFVGRPETHRGHSMRLSNAGCCDHTSLWPGDVWLRRQVVKETEKTVHLRIHTTGKIQIQSCEMRGRV